jgi:hypothetical protein
MTTPPFVTRVYIDFSTEIDFGPDEPRLCPTCGAVMQPAGARAWICPNQADQGNGISQAQRQSIRDMASKRDGVAPF